MEEMRLGMLAGPPFSPMQPDVEVAYHMAMEHLNGLGADVGTG